VGRRGGLLGMGAAFQEEIKVVDLEGVESKPSWVGDE